MLVSPTGRASHAANTIKIPVFLFAISCIYYSRYISYVNRKHVPTTSWPNAFETFEMSVVIICEILSIFMMNANVDGTIQFKYAELWITSFGYSFLNIVVFTPLNMFIKQIMLAQKKATSGYTATIGYRIAFASGVTILVILYALNVLAPNSYSNNLAMSNKIKIRVSSGKPVVLSSDYTCSNVTKFVEYVHQFPELFSNGSLSMCPLTSGGIDLENDKWCGFSSWEEACWNIGIIPSMLAVTNDVNLIVAGFWVLVLFHVMFVGRGIIKRNQSGGLDESSLSFLARPRILFVQLCMFVMLLIFLFCIADITINGNFIRQVTPMPPPDHPMNHLPAHCYGSCPVILFSSFGCFAFLAAVFSSLDMVKQCRCCGYLIADNTKALNLLELGAQTAEDLLYPNQKALLLAHLKTLGSNQGSTSKFRGTSELVTGAIENVTEGLQSFLCINDQSMKEIRENPEQAIVNEVCHMGNKELIELLKYIREEPVSEKLYPNGVRDKGRQKGMRLEDFMKHENVGKGNLKRWHVIALRLYTTSAYKYINNPLRDMERKKKGEQHPLSATVLCIEEGIKKLRNVVSQEHALNKSKGAVAHSACKVLWRGIKEVHANKDFLLMGGAELAPMSTTSNFKVAMEYGICQEGSLLLKVLVDSALDHGADIQWLSAFPGESEVLYPPLTFLKSTQRYQQIKCEKKGGAVVNILEMIPNMSASA